MPTALIGSAISGIGGLLSSRGQNRANRQAATAAEFNPFNISGAGGNVNFNNGAAGVTGDAQSQMFQSLFGQQAQNAFSNQQGGNAVGFGNQINFGNEFGLANQQAGTAGAFNAGNMFSQFSGQNAAFGQGQGINSLAMGNNFGQQQGGFNEGIAQGLFGQGAQALGQTDFSNVAADQLSRFRAAARPAEERAVDSKFQNLFSRGILSSTAGNRQVGELALQQEVADIGRVNASEQFANQLTRQNQQFGLQAFGQGLSARGQDLSGNLQRAGIFSNQGQGLLNFGQGAGQAGFNTQFGLNQLQNTRGQQRLQNAGQLFGFGQQAQGQNFNQLLQSFGASSQGNADLRNLIALGGNLGQAGAQAGARQGEFLSQTGGSGAGSFLSGLGNTIGNSEFDFGGLFGGNG